MKTEILTYIASIAGVILFIYVFSSILLIFTNFRIWLIKLRFRAQEKVASAHGEKILFRVSPEWNTDGKQKKWKKYVYTRDKSKQIEGVWTCISFFIILFMPFVGICIADVDITFWLWPLFFFLLFLFFLFGVFVRAFVLGKQGAVLLTEHSIIVFPSLLSNEYKTYERNKVTYVPYKSVIRQRKGNIVLWYYIFYSYFDRRHKIFEIVDGVHSNAEDFMSHFPDAKDSSIKVSFGDAPHPEILFWMICLVMMVILMSELLLSS